MENNLTYTKVGDYLYPNIVVNPQPEEPLTKYGMLRKDYLMQHDGIQYLIMQGNGTLISHCLNIQKQAEERLAELIRQIAQKEEVSEVLKDQDQIEWAAQMTSIQDRAEEIILQEIVFA